MTPGKGKPFAPSSPQPTRRNFLKTAALLAGGSGLIAGLRPEPASAAAADARYAGGLVGLDLDGQVEILKSADGGFAKAEVVTEAPGPSPFLKKHIAGIKYENITMQCPLPLSKAVFTWVAATLGGKYQPKKGAIVNAGYDHKEQSRLEFFNAVITEIGFPACDGASKEAGFLSVKLAPEYTRPQGGGGMMKPEASKARKAWISNSFKLSISGAENASTRVNRIEPLVVKLTPPQSAVGEKRDYQKDQGKPEFPNLVITVAESQAGDFYRWFEDFVVKGNARDDRERPGQLDYLAPDMRTVLASLRFDHLGIFSFAPVAQASGAESIRRVKVEMYCEQITFVGPSAPPA